MEPQDETTTTNQTTSQATGTPAGAQKPDIPPAGQTATTAQGAQAEPMIPKSRFDEINNKLKALETEAKARETAEAQATEQRLKEQQKWQELAEQRETELATLKPKATMADALSIKLRAQIDAEIAKWPEQVKAMAPAKDAPITDWLDWTEKARALVKELEAKPPVPGNGRPPKAAGQSGGNPPPRPPVPGMRL